MGNVSSKTISQRLSTKCLDIIQEKGLQAFASHSKTVGIWQSIDVYGDTFSRNPCFEAALEYLMSQVEKRFKSITFRTKSETEDCCNFIAFNLTHHIMKCLLGRGMGVSINFQEVIKVFPSTDYLLPNYDEGDIYFFQQEWMKMDVIVGASEASAMPLGDAGVQQVWSEISLQPDLSLDSTDEHEKKLLSMRLALKVQEILFSINLVDFIASAITQFTLNKALTALPKFGVFAKADAGASNLEVALGIADPDDKKISVSPLFTN